MTTLANPVQASELSYALRRRSHSQTFNKYKLVAVIAAVALIPRIYWMLKEAPVISIDGSEYVRMAENLAYHHRLTGNFEGPATMYTPFFSLLTAAVTVVSGKVELAARLVA